MSLQKIQQELVCQKSQRNTFGNYNYRSCEDILEAVKPLLSEHNSTLFLSDEMVEVGGRVYVKATATFKCGEDVFIVTANACEAETKKGMDSAQITGAASSYARKYALNGLFLIDDTKDADTDEHTSSRQSTPTSQPAKPNATSGLISEAQGKRLFAICKNSGTTVAQCANKFGFKKLGEIKKADYQKICEYAELGQKEETVQEVFNSTPDDAPPPDDDDGIPF